MFKSLISRFSSFVMVAMMFSVFAIARAEPAYAGECLACHVSGNAGASRTMPE